MAGNDRTLSASSLLITPADADELLVLDVDDPTDGAGGTDKRHQLSDFKNYLKIPVGLTGATAATRFVGATTGGAPVSGTFLVGDFIIDQTGSVWVCTVSGTPGTWAQPAGGGGGGGTLPDLLMNGGLDFAQRMLTPGTLTTIADKGFGPDRFRSTRENADLQYVQNDATGETGLTSRHYGQFKKITNTGKFVVTQILEGVDSVPFRSKTVIFQIKMKASSAKTIRIAVMELQNAGTIDTPPATLVTAFGANTVDPTFGANIAVISSAVSASVTTAWQNFSVSVTVPSNSKNLLVAFWTDSQFAANDTLSIAEAGLFASSSVQTWTPNSYQSEFMRCLRYCWSATGSSGGQRMTIGNATTSTRIDAIWVLQFPMRIAPTITTSAFGTFEAASDAIPTYQSCTSILGNITTPSTIDLALGFSGGVTAGSLYYVFANHTSGNAQVVADAEI